MTVREERKDLLWRSRLCWLWREWARPLLVTAFVLGSFRSAIADWNDVPTGSMTPTILVGDRIFVNKVAYDLKVPFTVWHLARWSDPARGDIVVLWSPYDGKRLVKRVVGIPGDVIEVREQRLVVNGQRAAYAPLGRDAIRRLDVEELPEAALATETLGRSSHAVMSASAFGSASSYGPVVVPPGQYFLMGDHRDDSFDSRYWGFADRGEILGRASTVVLSFDHARRFRPRWSRFLSSLR